MKNSAVNARDAGFELIRRVNRWTIAGAVVLTGAVSVAAAKSFQGHHTSTPASSTSSGSAASSGSSGSSGSSSSSSSPGLQQPSQAPSSAAPLPAPVVSGGS